MTILYKLTTQRGRTMNDTQWGAGVEHTASGEGELCGPGWLHAYTDPRLAALLNAIHANIEDPLLWEADGDVGKTDHGLKVGCTRLRTLRVMPLPEITTEQRVRFAILCAMCVCDSTHFRTWATGWLDGTDRSEEAAWAARAQAAAAEEAAWAVARAAEAAAWAAAAEAAEVAAAEAAAAARVARAADLDLIALAEEACQ